MISHGCLCVIVVVVVVVIAINKSHVVFGDLDGTV